MPFWPLRATEIGKVQTAEPFGPYGRGPYGRRYTHTSLRSEGAKSALNSLPLRDHRDLRASISLRLGPLCVRAICLETSLERPGEQSSIRFQPV
jgi:hypothetical protein